MIVFCIVFLLIRLVDMKKKRKKTRGKQKCTIHTVYRERNLIYTYRSN